MWSTSADVACSFAIAVIWCLENLSLHAHQSRHQSTSTPRRSKTTMTNPKYPSSPPFPSFLTATPILGAVPPLREI